MFYRFAFSMFIGGLKKSGFGLKNTNRDFTVLPFYPISIARTDNLNIFSVNFEHRIFVNRPAFI